MTNGRARQEPSVQSMIEAVFVDDALEDTYGAIISGTAGSIFTAKGCSINPDGFIKTLFGSLGKNFSYNASVYTLGLYIKILARKLALEYSALTATGTFSDALSKYTTEDVANKADRLSLRDHVLFTMYFVYYHDINDIAAKLKKTPDYIERKIDSLTRRLFGGHRDISADQAKREVRFLCDGLDDECITKLTKSLEKEAAYDYPSFRDSRVRKLASVTLFLLSTGLLITLFNLEGTINILRTADFLPAEWFIPSPEPVFELLVSTERMKAELSDGAYIVDSVVMTPDSNGLLTAEVYIIAPFKYPMETEQIEIQDKYGYIPDCTVVSPYKKTKHSSEDITVMDDMSCVIKYVFHKIDYTTSIILYVDDEELYYTLTAFSGIKGYDKVQWPADRGVKLKVIPVPESEYVLAYTVNEDKTGIEDSSYGLSGIIADREGEEMIFDFYTTQTDNGGTILLRSDKAQKIKSMSIDRVYKYYLYKEGSWFEFVIPNPDSGTSEQVNGSFSYRGLQYNISRIYRNAVGILDMYFTITPSGTAYPYDLCEMINLHSEYATDGVYIKDDMLYRFKNIGYAPNKVWISIVSQIITNTGEWKIKY